MVIMVMVYIYKSEWVTELTATRGLIFSFLWEPDGQHGEKCGWSLADDHCGGPLHVLEPVGVKVHQQLPHPHSHGPENQLHLHMLAWHDAIPEGERERERERERGSWFILWSKYGLVFTGYYLISDSLAVEDRETRRGDGLERVTYVL